MKKYRLTKITFRSREIVSPAKIQAGAVESSVCQIWRAPLPDALRGGEKRPAELAPANSSGADAKIN